MAAFNFVCDNKCVLISENMHVFFVESRMYKS